MPIYGMSRGIFPHQALQGEVKIQLASALLPATPCLARKTKAEEIVLP